MPQSAADIEQAPADLTFERREVNDVLLHGPGPAMRGFFGEDVIILVILSVQRSRGRSRLLLNEAAVGAAPQVEGVKLAGREHGAAVVAA